MSILYYFSDDLYFDKDKRCLVEDGKAIILANIPYGVVRLLAENSDTVIEFQTFLKSVWNDKNETHTSKDLTDCINKIHNKVKEKFIINVRGIGYKVTGVRTVEIKNPNKNLENSINHLPKVLTNSIVPDANTNNVILRDTEYSDILNLIQSEKCKALLLHGFGGVGKTSIARLLYANLQDDYDSIGWIDYHYNLKSSFVNSIDIEYDGIVENDLEKKWKYASVLLKNSRERKFFIIDNVDIDSDDSQDPLADKDLVDLSGWPNTEVIITSRISKLNGYITYHIDNLGNEHNCDNCIKLFDYYYENTANEEHKDDIEIKKNIVTLAGFNTMVIELLAKSCVYEESLESYYQKLIKKGFSYPQIPVSTMHEFDPQIASRQLIKLFRMKSRSGTERVILWNMQLLPEDEKVSRHEMENWLGFTIAEVDSLSKENWVPFKNGYFSIHPLIRQAIKLDINNNENYWIDIDTPNRNNGIICLIHDNKLFNAGDTYEIGNRKLLFAYYLSYYADKLKIDELLYLGKYSRKYGNRPLGVHCYKLAYNKIKAKKNNTKNISDLEALWNSSYWYGYMLSYTKAGFEKAKELLQESLKAATSLYSMRNSSEYYEWIGMSYDHLGYVQSNDLKNDIEYITDTISLFEKALEIRKSLLQKNPDNIHYLHDIAWTEDNLGTLISMTDESIINSGIWDKYDFFVKKSEAYLKHALEIRELIAKKNGIEFSNEVAWTLCNIAALLGKDITRFEDAENLYKQALDIYEGMEREHPGQHISSTARTYFSYGKLLMQADYRKEDAITALEKALGLNEVLEKDYPGVYAKEISLIKSDIKDIQEAKSFV